MLSEEQMRELRGREISMIFQEPMTSLNPVLTIGLQITEPLHIHLGMNAEQARERADRTAAASSASPIRRGGSTQYPHQFSGGMRQRVMIAIGLACNPKLIIADEPTTALDVTIQAQILELMKDLSRKLNIALIVITHNLGVVARYADRVIVMYAVARWWSRATPTMCSIARAIPIRWACCARCRGSTGRAATSSKPSKACRRTRPHRRPAAALHRAVLSRSRSANTSRAAGCAPIPAGCRAAIAHDEIAEGKIAWAAASGTVAGTASSRPARRSCRCAT